MDLSMKLTDGRTSTSPRGLRLAVLLAGLSCASAVSAPTVDAQSPRPRPGQQVVLVTGSTSGIGKAIAEALADEGCNIVLNGFGAEAEIEAQRAGLAEQAGVEVAYSGADMTRPAEIAAMVGAAGARAGALGVLVHNGGTQHGRATRAA